MIRIMDSGGGETCTVFEKTRQWGYRAIGRGWPDFPQWFPACFERAMGYNVQLPVPLSEPEVKAIAKSVARWTHKRFTESEFSRIQAIRGARGGLIGGKISRGGGRPSLGEPWLELGIRGWTLFSLAAGWQNLPVWH